MEAVVNLPGYQPSSASDTLTENSVERNTHVKHHNPDGADPSPYVRPLTRSNTSATRRSRALSRSLTRTSTKEVVDPHLDVNLPYRTLTVDANLEEYVTEEPSGEIAGPPKPGGGNYRLVTFLPGDKENPKNWSKVYKWYCTMVVAVTCFVVAFASSVITADIGGMTREFGVSEEVGLVTITVFVVGFGVGKSHLFAHQCNPLY